MIVYSDTGKKVTPTEFAKLMVAKWGCNGCFYWKEKEPEELMSDRERAQIDAAIEKQCQRVKKFLGID